MSHLIIITVILALAVLAVARRQGRTLPRTVRPLVEPNGDMPDDPAAALRELRARAERSNA
mgnify:CR=1 FL=1